MLAEEERKILNGILQKLGEIEARLEGIERNLAEVAANTREPPPDEP